jgi:hypothetical protein
LDVESIEVVMDVAGLELMLGVVVFFPLKTP